jgi:hypothetical protein
MLVGLNIEYAVFCTHLQMLPMSKQHATAIKHDVDTLWCLCSTLQPTHKRMHYCYLLLYERFMMTLTVYINQVKLERQLLQDWSPPVETTFAGLQPGSMRQLLKVLQ